ncbi:GH92 family glycosyl hydrolase [Microvirga sp. STS02]|uniref:GH92 family glycosyl hydrolase n=1 Tax=Hymenobacter negativus TaxID=2795026 RepID=UPI0018DDD0BD|nr:MULTISPECIES: GH92 family glycosyl hydrolase [Bacteria]MBH8569684.1 GH92 family glycosyl hydrolase [Hymenobacter negativus]MBR7209422.1 GH92 family glycosyl hydrolase [Microvirga sp. STS02]
MRLRLLAFLIVLIGANTATAQSLAPADLVNPLMGTDSKPDLSNGNTYPAISRPWGMNCWMPQTGKMGNGWAYQYGADKIRGFKQTHQPSPWMNDYGQFVLMPGTGKIRVGEDERASWFSHKSETARPYYYSVYLADYNITTELAPTERAVRFRFTFPKTDSAYVLLDALDKGSFVKLLPAQNRIIGYTTRNRGGVPANFKNYFIVEFDRPFTATHLVNDNALTSTGTELTAAHAGAVVSFRTGRGEQVQARVASSFISPEQAERNLLEIGTDDFETVKQKGRDAWNKALGRVEIQGGTDEQQRTFYSCLYRSLLFPRKFYELDAAGQAVHYSPYNGQVQPGFLYTDTGFWDTFRALFPLLNLMYPSVNAEIQAGLANAYREGGWLPEWGSPGYRNIMVGNNSASVVAEAYLKGGRGYDINTLYQALTHGANNAGPLEAVGRAGVSYYNKLGYVPYDVKINESAARTLEYAYDDFAIAQLATALKRPKKEIALYTQRSQNYRKLFDKQSGLMRGRNQNGTFQTPFNPFKWGDAFTEGNSWHYTWSVFHDVQGLMNLMGGPRPFLATLDSVFTLPPIFDEAYYGEVIHEIREMQIANMGQYAHGNQPAQHIIYLYNYAAQPWKAQYWAREAMNRLYRPTPDGYCGDEDNGQTSAWYVFSALGFYPVCPASDQYVLGAPLFPKATLHLENGHEVVLNAPANSAANRYIGQLKMNGQPYRHNWLGHAALQQGATLDFDMVPAPATTRGTAADDAPFSASKPAAK